MAKKAPSKLIGVAAKAVNRRCLICSQYISKEEAENDDFIYSKVGRGDVVAHKHCYHNEFGKKGYE